MNCKFFYTSNLLFFTLLKHQPINIIKLIFILDNQDIQELFFVKLKLNMSDPILKMIQSSNPQEISNYIKNYLPNDPVNLERIYNELLQFSTNFSQKRQKQQSIKRHSSLKKMNEKQTHQKNSSNSTKHTTYNKNIKNLLNSKLKQNSHKLQDSPIQQQNQPPHIQYFDRSKQQYLNNRYDSLTRDLKDKGIRPNHEQLSFGLKICKQQQDKIVKPLLPNSKVIFNQQTQISDQIKRFNINTKFYKNDINDAQIDQERFYDRKMKAFLDRRKSSLVDILTHKNQIKEANNRKFPNVQSKLFSKTSKTSRTESILNLGIESAQKKISQPNICENKSLTKSFTKFGIQSQITNNFKIQKLSQANMLLDYCKNSLSKKSQIKARFDIDNQKLYEKTMNRLSGQVRFNNLNKIQESKKGQGVQEYASTEIMIQKAKNNFLNQYYGKYDGNYIKMVRNIQTQRTKKGIMQNKKDLLKNQLMFRKIMKSSKSE